MRFERVTPWSSDGVEKDVFYDVKSVNKARLIRETGGPCTIIRTLFMDGLGKSERTRTDTPNTEFEGYRVRNRADRRLSKNKEELCEKSCDTQWTTSIGGLTTKEKNHLPPTGRT